MRAVFTLVTWFIATCTSIVFYILWAIYILIFHSTIERTHENTAKSRRKRNFLLVWTFSIYQLCLFWIFTMILVLCSSHFDARVVDCSSNYVRKCFSNTSINFIPSVRFSGCQRMFVCLFVYAFSTIDHKFQAKNLWEIKGKIPIVL